MKQLNNYSRGENMYPCAIRNPPSWHCLGCCYSCLRLPARWASAPWLPPAMCHLVSFMCICDWLCNILWSLIVYCWKINLLLLLQQQCYASLWYTLILKVCIVITVRLCLMKRTICSTALPVRLPVYFADLGEYHAWCWPDSCRPWAIMQHNIPYRAYMCP